jgi:long-chain fatty acid transport protein
LKSFSIQPTVSYRPFDRLSFGAGLMVMYGDFSLSRALIPAGGLESLRSLTPMIPGLATTLDKFKDIDAASATLAGDAGVKLGFNLGAMYDVNDKISLGVSYRSKVTMKVPEGHAIMSYANESELKQMIATVNSVLTSPLVKKDPIVIPPLDKGTFTAELPLPSNLNVAVSYKPTDRLLLTGEVQFVGWSAYDKLNVQFSQEVLDGYSINAPKMYENTRIYRLGGQFAATKRLDLRLGTYYDESPVPDEFLNPETPSMNKLGITTGFSFRPLVRLSVDLAFAYVTGFGRDGSYPYDSTDLTKTFGGHYEVNAFNSSLGISYAF